MAHSSQTVSVKINKISCVGDPQSPHPKVFLAFNAQGVVVCPYCGRRFEKDQQETAL